MKKNNERTVSIIGTGLSSIFSCLRISEALSVRIQVFDKARGLGGRLATRRADGGRFDHGAQYMKINEISNLKEIENGRWTYYLEDGAIETSYDIKGNFLSRINIED